MPLPFILAGIGALMSAGTTAAAAAGAAATAAAATAATAAGAAATAAGAAATTAGALAAGAAGTAATAAGTIATTAVGAAGSALTAAGSLASAAAPTVGRLVAKETAKKIAAGLVGGGLAYKAGESNGYDKGERNGLEKGHKLGYKQGCIDTARKFDESVEQHIARVCALYAVGMHIGYLDGQFDSNDDQAVINVLGSPELQEEYVKKRLYTMLNNIGGATNFNVIAEQYLSKVSSNKLAELDEIVRMLVDANGRKEAYTFYESKWKPYLRSR